MSDTRLGASGTLGHNRDNPVIIRFIRRSADRLPTWIISALISLVLLVILMGCAPRLDSKDWEERRTAVQRVNDQAVLTKIAVEDEQPAVRDAAVERLSDQALLAKVALESSSEDIRHTAAGKLADPALLERVDRAEGDMS